MSKRKRKDGELIEEYKTLHHKLNAAAAALQQRMKEEHGSTMELMAQLEEFIPMLKHAIKTSLKKDFWAAEDTIAQSTDETNLCSARALLSCGIDAIATEHVTEIVAIMRARITDASHRRGDELLIVLENASDVVKDIRHILEDPAQTSLFPDALDKARHVLEALHKASASPHTPDAMAAQEFVSLSGYDCAIELVHADAARRLNKDVIARNLGFHGGEKELNLWATYAICPAQDPATNNRVRHRARQLQRLAFEHKSILRQDLGTPGNLHEFVYSVEKISKEKPALNNSLSIVFSVVDSFARTFLEHGLSLAVAQLATPPDSPVRVPQMKTLRSGRSVFSSFCVTSSCFSDSKEEILFYKYPTSANRIALSFADFFASHEELHVAALLRAARVPWKDFEIAAQTEGFDSVQRVFQTALNNCEVPGVAHRQGLLAVRAHRSANNFLSMILAGNHNMLNSRTPRTPYSLVCSRDHSIRLYTAHPSLYADLLLPLHDNDVASAPVNDEEHKKYETASSNPFDDFFRGCSPAFRAAHTLLFLKRYVESSFNLYDKGFDASAVSEMIRGFPLQSATHATDFATDPTLDTQREYGGFDYLEAPSLRVSRFFNVNDFALISAHAHAHAQKKGFHAAFQKQAHKFLLRALAVAAAPQSLSAQNLLSHLRVYQSLSV